MDELRRYYANSNVDMPQRHYFNRFARDFKQWALKYFDQAHFTCPLYASTGEGFSMPGEFVGQYGAYEAIKHIYQSNAKMAHLVTDNSIYISDKYFGSDLEKGISSVRSEWRAAQGIDEKATVIFFAPGNEKEEAEFSCENVRKGIKEFLLKYSAPTSLSPKASPLDNFVTVISLHSGSEGERYVREYLNTQEWFGKVVFVSEQDNGHLDAMCSADMGLAYDGQIISSAVACHLPVMSLIKMRMHH